MRFLYLPCLLLFFVFAALTAKGQVCTGSLGDPVIHEDFGSGTGLGPPLPTGVTSYFYANKECPDDSWYSIVNRVDDCFGLSWHNIRDASNVPNGYFMLVNADANPGIFYTQRADASSFCANTTYEFAAMVTNVMRTSACGNGGIRPNLTFRIETEAGALVKEFDSGDLPPDGIWRKYGTFFTLTSNASLIVKIINNAPGGCGNDLALDDITFRACGPQVNVSYNAGVPSNVEICEGTNNNYTITATAPPDYQNFQWQQNINGAWEDIVGQTGSSYAIPPTGTFAPGLYQYRVATVSNGNIGSLNCRIFSQPNTILVNPTPVVLPPADQFVCTGSALQLNATGGNTYVWRRPNMPASLPGSGSITINSATNTDDGIYEVYAISDKGCISDTKQFRITVIPPVIANVSPNTDVCVGQNVSLQATGGLYYQWFPAAGLSQADIPNPVASPTQTTTYTVRVSNDACFDEATVTVNVLQYPVAIAPNPIKIFEGQPVVLNATTRGDNIVETSWSPTTFLDDPQSLTPTATPPYDMTYTLTVRSASCGESTSSVFVRVYRKVTIPNTFTPNGDGFNDLWNISQLYTYPESTTTVFTRSGQQVFYSEGYSNPWNGTHNGQQLPAGTYYYVIDLKNGTKPLQGWVTLLR